MDLNDPDKIKELIAHLELEAAQNQLATYRPYPKQAEFHKAGVDHRERLLMAGNQLGKTLAGAMETAMHAAGRYPDWWQGKRFDKPTVCWVAGQTGETVKALGRQAGPRGYGCNPQGCAFVEMAWDRDLDVMYLVRTLRLREQTPIQHSQAVRHWGLHWAWPHDGNRQELAGAGVPLAQQYKDAGLDLMFNHAQFEDGTLSVEAGLMTDGRSSRARTIAGWKSIGFITAMWTAGSSKKTMMQFQRPAMG